MSMYRILMDSIKLFFVNVFLFVIVFEGYVLLVLVQEKLNSGMPFFGIFYLGVVTFMGIIFWMNISNVWLQKVKSHTAMMMRVFYSEVPFVMLVLILWVLNDVSNIKIIGESYVLSMFWFILLYPIVMYTARFHTANFEPQKKRKK